MEKKNFLFEQTSLVQQVGQVLETDKNQPLLVNATEICGIADAAFAAIVDTLDHKKSKDKKVALMITGYKGQFLIAGTIVYDDGWKLGFTFKEDDIKDYEKEIASDSVLFQNRMFDCAIELAGMRFTNISIVYRIVEAFFSSLVNWLDTNSNDGDITIEKTDIFEISTTVVDDVKVYTCTPGENIKTRIKNEE